MNLTTRFTLSIVLITTLCLTVFAGYQYVSTKSNLYTAIQRDLDTKLTFTKAAISQPIFNFDDRTVDGIIRALMDNTSLQAVMVFNFEESEDIPAHGFYRNEKGKLIHGIIPIKESDPLTRSADINYNDYTLGRITIQASLKPMQEQLSQALLDSILEILTLNVLLSLFIISVVKFLFLHPILSLTKAARDVSEGDYQKKIQLDSPDEIGTLGKSLAKMRDSILAKIESLEEKNKELSKSKTNLATTLNSIGDAVIVTDAEGKIIRMNPIAEQLTGWSFIKAEGMLLPKVFVIMNAESREKLDNPVDIVLKTGETAGLSKPALMLSKNNREYLISDSGSPIRDENGAIVGVVLVFRDITKEHTLEQQLRHSQKLEAVGQLAGGVAHDFNNMLGGIIGATELLEKYLVGAPKARKLQQMILDAANRAGDLTKNLLTFSRTHSVPSSAIDVHDILQETSELLKNTIDRRIHISLELSSEISTVVGEPSQLQSAFLNLGINSSQAMRDGGTLTIATKNVEIDETYCNLSTFELHPGNYLEIEIKDTGHGIEPEHLDKIFDPFFTTKKQGQGTGLGLSVVYGTIQQHLGAITAYSQLNIGTTFVILLPLSSDHEVLKQGVTTFPRGEGKILVVDDEELMRFTAQAILEDLGYEVVLAENGKEAVTIYSEHSESIDLVILDMMMPVMNGRDCFTALKQCNRDVKVILSSGFTPEEYLKEMSESGLKGFIRKPYSIADLSQIVFDVISKP